MDNGLPIEALALPTKPKTKASPGLAISSLAAPTVSAKPSDSGPSAFGQYLEHGKAALKAANQAAMENPVKAREALFSSVVKATTGFASFAASGVAALAKTMANPGKSVDEAVDHFTKNQQQLERQLQIINTAPENKQEEAFMGLLNLLPEGIQAVGDTVYDKTRSALLGAGAQALTTLLTLAPGSVVKVLKGGYYKLKPTKTSTAIDELAATQPEAAETIVRHIGEADPELSKEMKKQIREGRKATKDDLKKVGRRAAEADFQEDLRAGQTIKGRDVGAPGTDTAVEDAKRHAEMLKRRGTGQPPKPPTDPTSSPKGDAPKGAPVAPVLNDAQRHAAMLRRMEAEKANVERSSATIRTAVKEGTEAVHEALATLEAPKAEIKQFPKQTVPGSSKDFVNAVTKGTGTSKMNDQLAKGLQSYISKNAGEPAAWSVDHMKENWKGELVHSPGYSYAWQVKFPWGKEDFRTEMEARQHLKKTQAEVDKQVEKVAGERKAKGIPEDQSLTEWNNNRIIYMDKGVPVTHDQVSRAFKSIGEDGEPPCL